MNEPKNEAPQVAIQAARAPRAKRKKCAARVMNGKARATMKMKRRASGASRRSLLASAKAMLRKFFSGNRGTRNRSFFDNDDDASPSAA